MNKTVIIFGSTTGNTETVAKWIKEALLAADVKTELWNAADIKVQTAAPYDMIIFGSSTWGQGDMQDDFINVYNDLTEEILSGKKVAVFGCGDNDMFPDNFCQAVDEIEKRARECGAQIMAEALKIDGDVDPYETDIKKWASSLI